MAASRVTYDLLRREALQRAGGSSSDIEAKQGSARQPIIISMCGSICGSYSRSIDFITDTASFFALGSRRACASPTLNPPASPQRAGRQASKPASHHAAAHGHVRSVCSRCTSDPTSFGDARRARPEGREVGLVGGIQLADGRAAKTASSGVAHADGSTLRPPSTDTTGGLHRPSRAGAARLARHCVAANGNSSRPPTHLTLSYLPACAPACSREATFLDCKQAQSQSQSQSQTLLPQPSRAGGHHRGAHGPTLLADVPLLALAFFVLPARKTTTYDVPRRASAQRVSLPAEPNPLSVRLPYLDAGQARCPHEWARDILPRPSLSQPSPYPAWPGPAQPGPAQPS
ncbi:uncharacterized protein PSFLO_03220 [Pseudozyma flocculosa]|uniref:Uncharacterized protein n=1 Tax=Pseudozyma flocculosa TaxID=84751 RepID=A0A5C3EZP8_9BASI|nr:uncharacterized protein PSFLO_03220 [Pseudozyma flocculosa]